MHVTIFNSTHLLLSSPPYPHVIPHSPLQLLSNEADFDQFLTEVFSDWDVKRRGKLSQSELAAGIKKLGAAFGLPPPAARDADKFYRELFVSADMDDSGFVDKRELGDLLRGIFKQLVDQLEKSPVVVESTLLLD